MASSSTGTVSKITRGAGQSQRPGPELSSLRWHYPDQVSGGRRRSVRPLSSAPRAPASRASSLAHRAPASPCPTRDAQSLPELLVAPLADILSPHDVDHVLRDVGRVIGDALQVP